MTEASNEGEKLDLLTLTTDIVTAHVSSNSVPTGELPDLIKSVHDALTAVAFPKTAEPEAAKPQGAVSIRKSLSNPNHIISMLDGKPYKALRRHLKTHGHTPESYRDAFGLAKDYPMVAAAYSEARRTIAKALGLGQKKAEPEPVKAPARRGRKPAAE